jgi:hypothetical protein
VKKKKIKPGALVKINAGDKPIVDVILGWHLKTNKNEMRAELFKKELYGLYLGVWKKIENGFGPVEWHKVFIGDKFYLFTREQIEEVHEPEK